MTAKATFQQIIPKETLDFEEVICRYVSRKCWTYFADNHEKLRTMTDAEREEAFRAECTNVVREIGQIVARSLEKSFKQVFTEYID